MLQIGPKYGDYPLEKIVPIPGKSYGIHSDKIVIPPLGKARGTMKIPEGFQNQPVEAQPRSSWARARLQILPDRKSGGDTNDALRLVLVNWSSVYGLVIRRGDLVTLANLKWIRSLPPVKKISLHAGPTVLKMRESALQTVSLGDRQLRVLDPDRIDLYACMYQVPYDKLILARGESAVLPVEEASLTPENWVGVYESVRPDIVQNASCLDKPGSNGKRVMEVRAFRHFEIRPGDRIGTLSFYESPVPLPLYTGRFNN